VEALIMSARKKAKAARNAQIRSRYKTPDPPLELPPPAVIAFFLRPIVHIRISEFSSYGANRSGDAF
jgi:hypothetical protein